MEIKNLEQVPEAVSQLYHKVEIIERLLSDTRYRAEIETDQFLTVPEAAKYLGLAIQTIYGLVSRREIPHSKKGNRLYFDKSDINTWVNQGRRKTIDEINEGAKVYGRTTP